MLIGDTGCGAAGAGAAGSAGASGGVVAETRGAGSCVPEQVARLLHGRPVEVVHPGLSRTRAMLEALGRPERSFRSLHVGGTNGKGSIAVCAGGVLAADGRRTGLYLSPHVVEFGERIQLSGTSLEPELLDRCARRVLPEADRVEASHFEALTVLAFLALAEAGAEWVVAEVGMGGRLDSTNVLEPEACAISGVALDHEEYLGDSLRDIAVEKAGILKGGIPAVVAPMAAPARSVIRERARALGAPLFLWGEHACARDVGVSREGTRFRYEACRGGERPRSLELFVPLAGRHQARNAGMGLLLLEVAGALPAEPVVRRGLAGVRHPGRLEVLDDDRHLLVLDVAHNPAALDAALSGLEDLDAPSPRVALVSILADKPWRTMLLRLASEMDAVVCTDSRSAPPARRWPPARVAEFDEEGSVEFVPELVRALERARELAVGGTVLVTGSSYLVGDVLRSRTANLPAG